MTLTKEQVNYSQLQRKGGGEKNYEKEHGSILCEVSIN